MQNQKGKIAQIVDPQEIKGQYKKGQVVIEWTEKAKDKYFTKKLAMEVFSKKENFDKRWNYIIQNFSVGDNVEVSFDVVSNEGSNGGWFTSAKYINMKHQDKEVNGGQQQNSVQISDEDDDSLPF
jgi:hypothetical protein